MVRKGLKALLAVVLMSGSCVRCLLPEPSMTLPRGESCGSPVRPRGPRSALWTRTARGAGSSIELCELMAKEMGVKVVFQDYDWDGLIPALLSKKADILAADMTPTLKRAMKIAFSTPFMYTGSVVFTKADGAIKSMEDCKKPGHQDCRAPRLDR